MSSWFALNVKYRNEDFDKPGASPFSTITVSEFPEGRDLDILVDVWNHGESKAEAVRALIDVANRGGEPESLFFVQFNDTSDSGSVEQIVETADGWRTINNWSGMLYEIEGFDGNTYRSIKDRVESDTGLEISLGGNYRNIDNE